MRCSGSNEVRVGSGIEKEAKLSCNQKLFCNRKREKNLEFFIIWSVCTRFFLACSSNNIIVGAKGKIYKMAERFI